MVQGKGELRFICLSSRIKEMSLWEKRETGVVSGVVTGQSKQEEVEEQVMGRGGLSH